MDSPSEIQHKSGQANKSSELYEEIQNTGLTRPELCDPKAVGNIDINEREYENTRVDKNENPSGDIVNDYEGLKNPKVNHEYASLGVE